MSQARTESASQAAALGASQGASTGTFLAMAFMRAMAWAALSSATGLTRGMSPR